MSKKWYQSKTVWFFTGVLLNGGLQLIEEFVRENNFDANAFILLVISLVGIALRFATNSSIIEKE